MKNGISLTGKNAIHHNLSGKILFSQNIPLEIKNLKIYILNNIILPLISKKWDILRENLFCLDNIKKKINLYYSLDDLVIYKNIINVIEVIVNEHIELEELEKKVYGTKKEEFAKLVYKTTMIQLKPEYEIYNIIIGKPCRDLNTTYNEEIINDIIRLLKVENINFNKIKEYILFKYIK